MLTKDELTEALKIETIKKETSDTVSLNLVIPEELRDKFKYKAGQFVTIFHDIDNEEVRRSYSLSSCPDTDTEFTITVKKVNGGKLSPILCEKIKPGNTLHCTPPAGRFVLPENISNKTLVFFAAGSGITPVISLIKNALNKNNSCKCYLMYGSRNEDSIIFENPIKDICARYADRFHVSHILSAPGDSWSGLHGRLTGPMIENYLKNINTPKDALFYICGPEGFMTTCQTTLEINHYPSELTHMESFVSAEVQNNDFADEIGSDAVYVGDQKTLSRPESVSILLEGENIHMKPEAGTTILEQLMEEGHNPPYSCMNGSCMACLGKVEEGLVYQNEMAILTEDNLEDKECLTCQSYAASKNVKISYDF